MTTRLVYTTESPRKQKAPAMRRPAHPQTMDIFVDFLEGKITLDGHIFPVRCMAAQDEIIFSGCIDCGPTTYSITLTIDSGVKVTEETAIWDGEDGRPSYYHTDTHTLTRREFVHFFHDRILYDYRQSLQDTPAQ